MLSNSFKTMGNTWERRGSASSGLGWVLAFFVVGVIAILVSFRIAWQPKPVDAPQIKASVRADAPLPSKVNSPGKVNPPGKPIASVSQNWSTNKGVAVEGSPKPSAVVRSGGKSSSASLNLAETREKIKQQRIELGMVRRAILIYYRSHRTFPATLDQLTTPVAILERVPRDLFAPDRPLSYALVSSRGTTVTLGSPAESAVISSVGTGFNGIMPGLNSTYYLRLNISRQEGEMYAPVIPEKLDLANLGQISKPVFGIEYMEDLLRLREKEKIDNAMVYYALASWVWPGVETTNEEMDLEKGILEKGCAGVRSDFLRVYLMSYQPAFEYVRKGVALDRARGIGFAKGPSSPVPNFLAAQMLTKAFCIEGRYFESLGRYEEALQDYLTVLTMGRDYGSTGNALISHLIFIAINSIALNQLHDLVASGKLSCESLEQALARLEHIEQTQGTPAEAWEGEKEAELVFWQEMKKDPERMKKRMFPKIYDPILPPPEIRKDDGFLTRTFIKLNYQIQCQKEYWSHVRRERQREREEKEKEIKGIDYVVSHWDEVQIQKEKIWKLILQFQQTPYWQRDLEEFQRECAALNESLPDLLKAGISMGNAAEFDIRYFVMQSKLLQTKVAAGLEIYRIGVGRYPTRLSDLKRDKGRMLPVDPFSGKDFVYEPGPDGKSYKLYGAGPDCMDAARKKRVSVVSYDPTNGTQSVGEIQF